MLSSLDITRILIESSSHLVGARMGSIEYYRKERAVQIYLDEERRHCLTMSFHPQRNGFFVLPSSRSRLDTGEKPRPFAREMVGGRIVSVAQRPNDRIVEFEVKTEAGSGYLIFEILGPNGNLWVTDGDKNLVGSLRDRKFVAGQRYEPSPLPDKLDPATVTHDDLRLIFERHPDINPARSLEKSLYGIDYHLALTVIGSDKAPVLSDAETIRRIHLRLQEAISAYHTAAGSIYAYRIKGKIGFYPVKLADHDLMGRFATLSEAQKETVDTAREEIESDQIREETIKGVENRIAKAERLLENLEHDIAEASGYEQYRQYADLLKIHLMHLKRGMASITVDDLFGDGRPVDIPLDRKLNGRQNMEQYSKRYRKGKEGLELLSRRRDNIAEELKRLRRAHHQFEADFEQAGAAFPELLPRPRTAKAAAQPVRPYREYQTSTGLTILVGKTGANNDRTTFEYARPDDYWFHTSQCAGSHVVLRVPNKTFIPSKQEIAEAAALAAWHSKARGAAKVPVSYTQRRYVHKPRNAKPGLVLIDHEKTIMVAPQEPRKGQ